ncbi:MAG TPA: drug/metabolite exporter YedA [Polyangiaceae bacterium]|jgi:drug/metabolite transporter (DMT)-like permease
MPRRTLLVLAFLAVCIIWGSTYLGIRVTLESFPPFFIGAVRFIVAGAVLFGVARMRGETSPSLREWASAVLTGALFFVVGNGLVNVAELSVSSGLVSVLVATMPLWTTLFSRLFGTPVSGREAAGVVLGLVGVAVMNLGGELRASPGGAVCALLAPMGWALGSVFSQRLPLPGGMMRTASQMLGGGAATMLVSLALHEHLGAAPSLRAVLAVLYLCVFGSLVGFTAYSYLLAHTRPAVATSYAYVNPIIAVALGAAFAGERFGATSLVGAVIVLAAVALVGLARSRRIAPPAGAPAALSEAR